MAQDRVTRLVAGVPSSELTADNIEDFDNESGAVAFGDVVCTTENAVAKANSAITADLPLGMVIDVRTATSCRVITRGRLEGLEGITAGTVYYLNGNGTLSTTPAARVIPIGIGLNTASILVCPQVFNLQQLAAVDQYERSLRSILSTRSGSALGAQTAWWTYLGRTTVPLLVKYVEFYVSVVGVGAQTAEVGLFSTPAPPNKADQTLTKLTSTATLDDLTVGIGVKRNTNSLAYTVDANVHLWAGVRFDMATTQPNIVGLSGDCKHGRVLLKTNSATFAAGTTWAGVVFNDAGAVTGYHIMATLD